MREEKNPWNTARCGEPLCTGADGQAQSCCPLDAQGRGIPWRDYIASVTTLSTPHHGSSVADWGWSTLTGGGLVEAAFHTLADKIFGMGEAGQEAMQRTFLALSRRYSSRFVWDRDLPVGQRSYDWECVTRGDCAQPAAGHGPIPDAQATGGWRLPAPTGQATIFSWGASTCLGFGCTDMVSPAMLLSYRHLLHRESECNEGRNDGVVSTCSAQFGIFMGVRSQDHLRWTDIKGGGVLSHVASWFGHEKKPDSFYPRWLLELARAGY